MKTFSACSITNSADLVFGSCPKPVSITPDIRVGDGNVIPEINYILPYGSEVSASTIDEVVNLYSRMARGALARAYDLGIEQLIIEIELVFELTLEPAWGERVIRATREVIDEYAAKGVHAALRTTVADIRDRIRPPRLRTSEETKRMFECFERCAPLSDVLSIESTGGKEVSDNAILQCDIGGVVFALGLLGSNDMEFVWDQIVAIAARHGKVAGGDAACGFANTAMQLARKRMVPTVFAAVVRAVGAARSLVAIECGATGPDKDCAYEGPVLKAIAGIPIAMEGKSAACAHTSPLGNVAMACCDTWSNESVPYAQLFGGYTPEVMLEQLWYDCKLMNEARRASEACRLRNWLVASDVRTSAEALVLAPEACLQIGRAIVSTPDHILRSYRAANAALDIIEQSVAAHSVAIPEIERPWLDTMRSGLQEFATLGEEAGEYYATEYKDTFLPAEYGL